MPSSTRIRAVLPLALSALLSLAVPSVSQAPQVSDAQVEANVLKAFAGDARLNNQPINTSTVYGTVTLSGSVSNEAARDAAEQIAARTNGVKKVVDQLVIAPASPSATTDYDPAAGNSYPEAGAAAPPAAQGRAATPYDPAYDAQQPYAQPSPRQAGAYPPTQGQYPGGQPASPAQGYGQPPYQPGYSQPPYGQPPYGQQGGGYPDAAGAYPPPPPRRLYRRDYERRMAQGQYPPGQGYPPQGQPGGVRVVIPDGTVLPVSINHWISSGDAGPGSSFSALVANDILAGGQIAVPRGATVEGTVIDAKGAGALKGRGSLTLQLNTLLLGGQRIPLQSDAFTVTGHDKAARSINSTLVGAGLGALLGAAIGRGTGAAIGAGVGGAAGLGTAAASNGGQATLPPEALLRFRLTAPTPVVTVSEGEMQRLGGYAGPGRGAPTPYGDPYGQSGSYYPGGYNY